MPRLKRILVLAATFLILALPILSVATKLIYEKFEGGEISLAQALLFVVETMTSTGYGELLPFHSWIMVFHTLFLIFIGFGTIFILLSTVAGSYLQRTLSDLVPRRVPRNLKGHILIFTDDARGAILAGLLSEARIPYLMLTGKRSFAKNLSDDGFSVVHWDPEDFKMMARVRVGTARAVVADESDEMNMNISLAVKAAAKTPVFATVDDPSFKKYLEHAGASVVMPTKHALGEALARWIVSPVPEALTRTAQRFPGLHFVEMRIEPSSELAGHTLRELRFRSNTGATVLGMWRADSYIRVVSPDTVLAGGSLAVVMANDEQLERIKNIYGTEPRKIERPKPGDRCIVVGSGHVGLQAAEALKKAGLQVRIAAGIWKNSGDISDHSAIEKALTEAEIREASLLVIAINGDLKCLMATLVARNLNPEIKIVGRTNADEYVPRLLLAGADYAISLSHVASERLFNLIEGNTCPICTELNAVEIKTTPAMWGRALNELEALTGTGCIAAAIYTRDLCVLSPASDTPIPKGANMTILGEPSQIEEFLTE